MTSLTVEQKFDVTHFWEIMDYAFGKGSFNNEVREQAILEQLVKLTPEQIQEFEIIFQQMNNKSSTWENFAAQTAIEGASSDDRFFYFRCWLISIGHKNFEQTLQNPDYLASLDIPVYDKKRGTTFCWFEELIGLSDLAYGIVTGKDPSTDETFPRTHADGLGLFYDSNTDLTGKEWEDDEELDNIVPLLNKKYSHTYT